ncbi:Hypothetical predicted protein [Pelobates cultripes]|uniref:exodeoxyribonuclease III n=1 Tax=Pelobates cultripes TaxID=61616 RepID=A0AAD1RNJ0_PELCU|nr:Hypothetical predicted protein [Pelobates cultripes]
MAESGSPGRPRGVRLPRASSPMGSLGLDIPERRTHLLRELRQKRISIALLQETHFREDSALTIRDRRYSQTYLSNHHSSKKAGVAILLITKLGFMETDKILDPEGRYVFLKGTITNRTYTLACVYAPNRNQSQFIRRTLSTLADFTEGTLILGGDLNVPLDPHLDTSTGRSSIPQREIRSTLRALRCQRLVDCWRVLHPTQEQLTALQGVTIEAATWSDHGAVTMEQDSPLIRPRVMTWRLNDTLLEDVEIRDKIAEALDDYFSHNENGDTPSTTTWEAHKCVLRCYIIQLATKKKKDAQRQIAELLNGIGDIEARPNYTAILEPDQRKNHRDPSGTIPPQYRATLTTFDEKSGGDSLSREWEGVPCGTKRKICGAVGDVAGARRREAGGRCHDPTR